MITIADKAIQYAAERRERFLEELQQYLRIPSISTLPENKPDVRKAAEWGAENMRASGLQNVRLISTNESNPFVYGEWTGKPGAATVLVYGHYDCQPVDPVDAWNNYPFSGHADGYKVWARGASDNKGQHFAHLKAIESLLAANGELPINVKFLLEGEEEVSSPNIETFLEAHQSLLAADSGIISDGAMIAAGHPSLDYGLRGLAALELRLQGPERDLHSGAYGGTVLNPIQALARMITLLHNEDGSVSVPGFYDRIPEIKEEERELLARARYTQDIWSKDTGAPAPWGEPEYTLLERIGVRPTLDINGIWGGFQGEGTKTVLPARAGAKITMRLVPNQDPDEIFLLTKRYLEQIAPNQVEIEIYNQGGCHPAMMPLDSPEIRAAAEALRTTWGVEPVLTRAGGSLPVVAAFQRILGAPFVLMPFGLDDNRHSPNEHLIIDYFYRGIDAAIRFYSALGP